MGSDSIQRLHRLAVAHRWLRRVRNAGYGVVVLQLVELLAVGSHRTNWTPLLAAAIISVPVSLWMCAALASWATIPLAVLAGIPGLGLGPLFLLDRVGRRRIEQSGARVGMWGITPRELALAEERLAD